MKGQHLVIGLVLFVIAVVAAVYFTMMASFNSVESGMEPVSELVEEEPIGGVRTPSFFIVLLYVLGM